MFKKFPKKKWLVYRSILIQKLGRSCVNCKTEYPDSCYLFYSKDLKKKLGRVVFLTALSTKYDISDLKNVAKDKTIICRNCEAIIKKY